jgi:hypothetical protein
LTEVQVPSNMDLALCGMTHQSDRSRGHHDHECEHKAEKGTS